MKVIIIGTSLSGKTTLARYLREIYDFPISEIDEELTKLNKGTYPSNLTYKQEVLSPKIIKDVLNKDELLFFTNTDYFTFSDLELAHKNGYKIVQLSLNLAELKKRNTQRIKEGYEDMSQWFKGMLKYQNNVKEAHLVDKIVDATQQTEAIAKELLDFAIDLK